MQKKFPHVAGLCIGHLGHLHHKLDDSHFAQIGRLDIVRF
ncbi:hypothetical protein ACVIWV_010144 [Bradyrhizobium diazoefficiens]